ncbi:MAG: hypothetical protein JWP55_5377 [Mycobacterium sp.]|jgi:hypothetical protein|nr:hypothetical protein [Mycobacterium sp.]
MDDEPFRGRRAVRDGTLTNYRLRTRYRAIYRDVYVPNDLEVTAMVRARAAWLWAGPDCVLTGLSAAAALGTKWIDGDLPAELIRGDRHSPRGVLVRSYCLAPNEVCFARGMSVTTPARTGFDLGRTLGQDRAVPIVDALMAATRVKPADLIAIADGQPGLRGVRRLRATAELCDGGAESPQESRVRLILVKAGLPTPETQIAFRDEYGHVFIRVDMGWRQWKVAVEYDGVQHWSDRKQRSWDIDRIAMLDDMGWAVVRVSAELLTRPEVVIERVRVKLRAAGYPM